MLPFYWYLLKVILCSGILLGYYWLFLRNKLFHRYNRFYLLMAIGLSMLLPLIKINFWQQDSQTNGAIRVLQAVSDGDAYMNTVVLSSQKNNWNSQTLYPLLYWLVSLVFVLLLLRTLYIIRKLLKQYPAKKIEEINFINTDDDSTPFSFFKFIFWNNSIDVDSTTGRQIFKHEVAHIQEKHSYDKLFLNICLIFFWCNPFFWIYRKELNMIHEFIADKKAVEDNDTAAFAAMILQSAYPRHRFELTNNFFYSPIKRRLHMLTKIDNPRISYFVRLMVLPLAIIVFAAFTFKAKTNNSIYHGKKITVVIDAGHGGDDAGAKSPDGTLEKDLNLAIAKKVKELNENKDINIILTRETDILLTPQQRVEFAKSKNADLFISFHVDGEPLSQKPMHSGMVFYVSKNQYANSNQSKILASAIYNEFNNNYGLKINGGITQRQYGIWVIQANTCPAVLIETGFITNRQDAAYLNSHAAKETIAKNVLAGIEKYASSLTKENNLQKNITITDTVPSATIYNVKYTDSAYFSNADFKNKALVIIDSKEIGNVGYKYVETSNEKYNTVTIYKPAEAKKRYGIKGKYGAIKITQRESTIISGESMTFDDKTKNVIVTGDNIKLNGDFSDYLIFVEGKRVTAEDLNKIAPNSIRSINVTKSEDQADNSDINGKKSIIYISLKSKKEDSNNKFSNVSANDVQVKSVVVEERKDVPQDLHSLKQPALNEITIEGRQITDKQITVNNKLAVIEERKQQQQSTSKTVQGKKLTEQEIALLNQKKLQLQQEIASKDDNKIFIKTETAPEFIGGQQGWLDFLKKNLKAYIPVNNGAKAGKYTVLVKFIIHTDGSISDIKCVNDPGFGTCEEVKRIIALSSMKWTPAIQNGRKVNAYHRQPVTFVVEE